MCWEKRVDSAPAQVQDEDLGILVAGVGKDLRNSEQLPTRRKARKDVVASIEQTNGATCQGSLSTRHGARTERGGEREKEATPSTHNEAIREPPNGSRLSCGALKKESFLNLCAPSASSAC